MTYNLSLLTSALTYVIDR